MILTEEKARTKWCPEARLMAMGERDNGQKDTLVGLNRVHLKPDAEDLNPKPCRCLGSACMAWRWHHETKYDDEYMSHRQQGYCGKAGKP